jgi:hypothetical protein
MNYTTSYQITGVEPQAFFQVLQEMFHFHNDLFQVGSYSFLVVFLLVSYSLVLSAFLVVIVLFVSGRGSSTPRTTQLALISATTPFVMLLMTAGLIALVFYPKHARLLQIYSTGACTVTQGTITDLQIKRTVCRSHSARQGIFWLQKRDPHIAAYDQLPIVVNSDHSGFDNPTDPVIRDGQKVRIWMLEDKTNPPTILRIDTAPSAGS